MDKRKYTSLPYTEETVADGRYDISRTIVDRIVLHTTVGSAQAAINLFGAKPAPGKETSAHYMVKKDGGIVAFLEEYFTAYHCGNYAFNQRSIGIEHEDGRDYNGKRPDALYQSSAKLVADICKFYNIPCDKAHIFRHHDVPGASTACPDALDTDRIIREAQLIITPQPIQSMDNNWKQITDYAKGKFLANEAKDVIAYIETLKTEKQKESNAKDAKDKAVRDVGLDPQDLTGSLNKLLAKTKAECQDPEARQQLEQLRTAIKKLIE